MRPHARSACGAGAASEVFESGTEPFWPTGRMPCPRLTRREATYRGLPHLRRAPRTAAFPRSRRTVSWPFDGQRAGSGSPTVAGRTRASKQVRSPVWQAAPTWSTETSRASPSQSRRTALDPLHVAARVALAPVLLTAARPEGHPALAERAAQGLVVHPADHEDVAGVVLLHDGGDETVLVALEQLGDLRVEEAVGSRRSGHWHVAATRTFCRGLLRPPAAGPPRTRAAASRRPRGGRARCGGPARRCDRRRRR